MSCHPQLHAGHAGNPTAAPFYRALGYEDYVIYLRTIPDDQARE